jgi:hypothetical protein
MNEPLQKNPLLCLTRIMFACVAFAGAGLVPAALPDANSVASLRAKYAELSEQLNNSQFQRTLSLDSAESSRDLRGDIYALVDYPFAEVNAVLNNPAHWCDVLILHINTKYCRASTHKAGTVLAVSIGKKYDRPLDEAYRLEFAYRVAAAAQDYLEVQLNAETGPLGTSNYRILLEAVPVEAGRTFLHFTYSYAYDFAGRLAMQVYLATVGRSKLGFTIIGKQPNGLPDYIRGVRGVVERNTMRYYLAIDAYLGALTAPSSEQLEMRLQNWFTSSERYSSQLHEMDRNTYLDMKRSEYLRQQTVQ